MTITSARRPRAALSRQTSTRGQRMHGVAAAVALVALLVGFPLLLAMLIGKPAAQPRPEWPAGAPKLDPGRSLTALSFASSRVAAWLAWGASAHQRRPRTVGPTPRVARTTPSAGVRLQPSVRPSTRCDRTSAHPGGGEPAYGARLRADARGPASLIRPDKRRHRSPCLMADNSAPSHQYAEGAASQQACASLAGIAPSVGPASQAGGAAQGLRCANPRTVTTTTASGTSRPRYPRPTAAATERSTNSTRAARNRTAASSPRPA